MKHRWRINFPIEFAIGLNGITIVIRTFDKFGFSICFSILREQRILSHIPMSRVSFSHTMHAEQWAKSNGIIVFLSGFIFRRELIYCFARASIWFSHTSHILSLVLLSRIHMVCQFSCLIYGLIKWAQSFRHLLLHDFVSISAYSKFKTARLWSYLHCVLLFFALFSLHLLYRNVCVVIWSQSNSILCSTISP